MPKKMPKKKILPSNENIATVAQENPLQIPHKDVIAVPAAQNDGSGIPLMRRFPVVGIGASAGGLAAFEAFFSGMPANGDPGMAFVLVQHLAPDHKSILNDIVKRYTRMQVFEVTDGIHVEPNCIYIIPPNRDMAFLNGALHLLEPTNARGQRLPIDFFFRSLAQDQRELAICVVLSGTGSDGTLGVRAIKGNGGMAMAQSPGSTEFDGMPCSAIATGLVDNVLLPQDMPAQLIAFTAHFLGTSPHSGAVAAPASENELNKIFVLVRAQTGHDFSLYKQGTTARRIERRMAVNHIETIDVYVKYLQRNPSEVEALFRDLLIGVTNFFRDPEAIRALEELAIPKLFANKPAGGVVRVWTAGCSSGEESYSIAILLVERMEALKQNYTLQVFATDIDNQAIATARAGIYPAGIAADIAPQRLARFFIAEPDGGAYRIHKSIRDILVFSEQDVIKDPPFSKIDLISCRNLMIYMGVELQKKLLPLFHYALNPDGFLYLGTSETVGNFENLFTTIDRQSKLFQRKEDFYGGQRTAQGLVLPPLTKGNVKFHRAAGKTAFPVNPSLQALTEQAILQQVAASGALVNSRGDILYLHGRTGMYLEPAPGETGINNILKMAREGLRHELVTALHKVVLTKETVRRPGLSVKTNSHCTTVNLSIGPIAHYSAAATESALYLVVLEDAPPVDMTRIGQSSVNSDLPPDVDKRIAALQQELRAGKEYLQSTQEELEASNEELQSGNEELQAANEELETSKEELQSVNEELSTVNTELQTRVADLSRANNDMNNLLAGTDIGTVFLDHALRILRFTPAAGAIINLMQSDVGRPISHIASKLADYNRLAEDAQAVLDTLKPKAVDVKTTSGQWYTMRIQPYRTLDNVIEGAVVTFVDITDILQTRESLRLANIELLRMAVVVRDAHDAITVQDMDGRILAWNQSAVRIYGWSEAEALAMNVRDRIPKGLREEEMARLRLLDNAVILEPYFTRRLTKDGSIVEVFIISTALVAKTGAIYAIATTERLKGKPDHGQ
jgi:two-component system CheB/CheR fusion protein